MSKPQIKEKFGKEYKRAWALNHKESVRASQKKWRDKNKEKIQLLQQRWEVRNKERRKIIYQNYVAGNAEKIYAKNQANRKLPKASVCQKCGDKKTVERHHPDYNKPLEVMWLCHTCHMNHHISIQKTGETLCQTL